MVLVLTQKRSMTYRTCHTQHVRKDYQKFLGLITRLSPLIPNLADKKHNLRELLKKHAPFLWEEDQKQCFEKLKTEISQDSTLIYFDMTEMPVLQTNASLKGLGAALMQNNNKKTKNCICIKALIRHRTTLCKY